MWRLTFVANGSTSWIDFHCPADATRMMLEGYELGLFIQPEVHRVPDEGEVK